MYRSLTHEKSIFDLRGHSMDTERLAELHDGSKDFLRARFFKAALIDLMDVHFLILYYHFKSQLQLLLCSE